MAKTITVRLDAAAYELIRSAAEGERRSIANYLEYAALRYLTDEIVVSDADLVTSLREGFADAAAGRCRVVDQFPHR